MPPPKSLLLLSNKNHLTNSYTKEDQKWTKCRPRKVQNYVPCSPTTTPWTKKSTKFLAQLPPTHLPPTHTKKHIYLLPTNPLSPLKTVLTPLHMVFETSSQIIFVINWMSRCKQKSLTFAVNWRSFLRMSCETRMFKSTASNLNIYWRQ